MSIKLEGFDELEKRLKQFQKNANKLAGTSNVSFDKLFTPAFMSKYTDFSSFEELLEKGGFVVNSQEDFENIPDDEFDQHIHKNTKFDKWEDMLGKAMELYVASQLKF